MIYIHAFVNELLYFFNEMAIYLVFGFAIAALLHVLFPDSIVRRQLGKGSLASVIKSTAFGLPLPLCSCGVVPVATSLRKSGASKGSVVSFLISTPQIGADSFMITYSLIGWVFAVFRIVAALITALSAGIFINIFDKERGSKSAINQEAQVDRDGYLNRLKTLPHYMEYELFGSVANYLLLGLIIAGLIGVFIPDDFFKTYLGDSFSSMLLMLLVGMPMYVCASASTPIAASLLMKGISPGAALVFLLTGPATNALNFSTVTKIVGKKSTVIYLTTIAVISLVLGFLLNLFSAHLGMGNIIMHHHHESIPQWLKISGSIILFGMFMTYYLKFYVRDRFMKKEIKTGLNRINLNVQGMTCLHCASTVKKAVEAVDGTSDVDVDLLKKTVQFSILDLDKIGQVKKQISAAGYEV